MEWLLYSRAAFWGRIALGFTILGVMALVDLRRRGPHATRWREYAFLLAAACMAMAYGAVNDLVTSRISWEYFVYGKGLPWALGADGQPDRARLDVEAAKVGVGATWSAGLIIGACLLIANNPSPRVPQLSYRRLLRYPPAILAGAVVCGALLGAAGHRGWLIWVSSDFGEMLQKDEFRPRRFMAVFGIHLGAYIGATVATALAMLRVRFHSRPAEAVEARATGAEKSLRRSWPF